MLVTLFQLLIDITFPIFVWEMHEYSIGDKMLKVKTISFYQMAVLAQTKLYLPYFFQAQSAVWFLFQ